MYNFKELLDKSKSAVLIHGRHVEALGWYDIEFGNISNGSEEAGQVPRGLEIARTLGVDLVIFGTGASKKDGMFESEYILSESLRQSDIIFEYLSRKLLPEDRFASKESFVNWLERISICDTVSQNTTEEIAIAAETCKERDKNIIYQVSCPSHLPRCLLEWIKYRDKSESEMIFVPVASDTFFHGAGANDNVIVEYPHRGDAPLYATYRYVAKIFGIMSKGEKTFVAFLNDFKKLLESYDVDMTGIKPLVG